jgi:signal recognition particle receptor subunit beta
MVLEVTTGIMTTLYTFVAGSQGSGRTTFLRALGDPDLYWVDQETGVEYRHITVEDDLEVYLFTVDDPTRFDPLLELSERDLLGYIVMFDSTAPETWDDAKLAAQTCNEFARLPTVLGANKQDLPGARAPQVLGEWYGLDAMTAVRGVVAHDHVSARGLFLQLLYAVREDIDRLDRLIAELERLTATGGSDNIEFTL